MSNRKKRFNFGEGKKRMQQQIDQNEDKVHRLARREQEPQHSNHPRQGAVFKHSNSTRPASDTETSTSHSTETTTVNNTASGPPDSTPPWPTSDTEHSLVGGSGNSARTDPVSNTDTSTGTGTVSGIKSSTDAGASTTPIDGTTPSTPTSMETTIPTGKANTTGTTTENQTAPPSDFTPYANHETQPRKPSIDPETQQQIAAGKELAMMPPSNTAQVPAGDTADSLDVKEIEKRIREKKRKKKKLAFHEKYDKVTLYLEKDVRKILYLDAEGEEGGVTHLLNKILKQYYGLKQEEK